MQCPHNLCQEIRTPIFRLVSKDIDSSLTLSRPTTVLMPITIDNRQDASGRSGLDAILAVLARLIDPSFSESAGLCVGDLVLHLLRNAGQHLTKTVPSLLDALARRIAVAQSTIFTQVYMYDPRSTSNQSTKWSLTPADVVFTLCIPLDCRAGLDTGPP
jgi:hypothetical protein